MLQYDWIKKLLIFGVILIGSSHFNLYAEEKNLPLKYPRYGALQVAEVNLRVGPGQEYPIEWTYVREFLPVLILSEFGVWRKIRDIEGTEGWVHQSALSVKRRTVSITGNTPALYKKPELSSAIIAYLETGVIASLKKCHNNWCRIKVEKKEGWIPAGMVWGLTQAETSIFK